MIARSLLFCLVVVLVAGCSGPPAPDAAVCQDFIHRICLAPRCPGVDAALNVGEGCEAELLARTGCGAEDFTFTQPSREVFLQCRVLLLRAGSGPEQHPRCGDVEELIERCGEVVVFLREGR